MLINRVKYETMINKMTHGEARESNDEMSKIKVRERIQKLRDFMKEKIFKGEAGNVALEEKMDEVLPILQKKKLMTKKMGITKLGRIAVAAKETASHSNKDRKTIH